MKGCGELEVQFHTFWKSVLDGGEWSASPTGCFVPGKEPLVSVKQGPGWASDLVWALWRRETFFDPAGNRRKISRSSSQYTNELPQLIKNTHTHTHTHTQHICVYTIISGPVKNKMLFEPLNDMFLIPFLQVFSYGQTYLVMARKCRNM